MWLIAIAGLVLGSLSAIFEKNYRKQQTQLPRHVNTESNDELFNEAMQKYGRKKDAK